MRRIATMAARMTLAAAAPAAATAAERVVTFRPLETGVPRWDADGRRFFVYMRFDAAWAVFDGRTGRTRTWVLSAGCLVEDIASNLLLEVCREQDTSGLPQAPWPTYDQPYVVDLVTGARTRVPGGSGRFRDEESWFRVGRHWIQGRAAGGRRDAYRNWRTGQSVTDAPGSRRDLDDPRLRPVRVPMPDRDVWKLYERDGATVVAQRHAGPLFARHARRTTILSRCPFGCGFVTLGADRVVWTERLANGRRTVRGRDLRRRTGVRFRLTASANVPLALSFAGDRVFAVLIHGPVNTDVFVARWPR